MSVYQFTDASETPELQIWNNAAFDNGESEDSTAIKASWTELRSGFMNQSFESDWSKENQNPVLMNSSSSVTLKSAASIVKPIQSSKTVGNHPWKGTFETFSGKSKKGKVKQEADDARKREDRNIDAEIEEIENEIGRLSSRLECLRLEKAEQVARRVTLRGRVVPAKFMEQKAAKIEDSSFSSAKPTNRRGVSLGPAEIFSAEKSRQPGKRESITPLQSIQSRRKSCFWKLQDIDEDKVTKERGRKMSSSLSPKSRKAASKIQSQKQAATTVGSKRAVKKEEGILSTIQPKNLFKDGEKSVKTAKKPLKPGRIVASRYSQTAEKDARKRSLPENNKEESNRCEKRRASNENGNQKSESSRVKKRWEIPSEIVVYKNDVKDGETPSSVAKTGKELQKIRTLRCIAESPRDSGAAKRVAELVGKKSVFGSDEDAGDSVCQSLTFEAEDAED